MSQTTANGPPSVPPPPSFNDFSFMSIGLRRSLLDRLSMAPQLGSAGESTNPPAVAFPPAPIDTSTISLVSENSIPSLGTSDTANSSLLGPATPPLIPGDAPASGHPDMSPTKTTGHTAPPCPVSALDMEVDERADPDVVELPRPPPPRIPERYRSLPADHYLVAPPAVLPYPRSPPLRIDENHPLYTPATLFAHLPRAPPLSPRLDPLAILELEATREQSEWEQVCQGLGRPTLSASVAENSFSARLANSQPVPQSPLAIQPNVEHSPSGSASVSVSAVDPDSDVDSSDVELNVYDHVPPVTSTLLSLDKDTANSQTLPAPSASQSNPTLASISDPSRSSTTPNPRVQPRQPQGLFSLVPHRTESAFGKGGVGPASSSVANGGTTYSTGPTITTPAKRKHDAANDSACGTAQSSAPEPTRVGVPPPLRASVDRTHMPAPVLVPEEPSAPIVSAAPPTNTVPTLAPIQPATTQPLLPSAPTPAPDTIPQPARKPCRFYNRPPGRVCIRKEQCPDLHEGPLQRPLSASVLAASTIPTFPNPFGPAGSPSVASTEPPASDTAAPSTTPHETTAVSRPQVTASPRPLTPPAPANSTPESSVAPAPSRSTAPASSVMSRRITSAGLPPRPLSSVDRPATPACRFFNTPKGCARGRECSFRHERKPSARSRTQSGDSGVSINGPSPITSIQPTAISGQSRDTQPPASSGSLRVSPKADNSAAGMSAALRNADAPVAKVDAAVVKTERESPAPKSSGDARASQPKSQTGPSPMSREIKEEEVTLCDLGDGPPAAFEQEMANGTSEDAGGTTPNNGPILPASLSSAPISEHSPVPNRIPSQTAPQPGPMRVPAAVREQPSTGPVPLAPASAPPAVLSTVVIPPTPVHPPTTGKGVAYPSAAPSRVGIHRRVVGATLRPALEDIHHPARAHALGHFHPRVGEMVPRPNSPGLEDTPLGDPSRRVSTLAMPGPSGVVALPVALGARNDILGGGALRPHLEMDVCPYEERVRRVVATVGRLAIPQGHPRHGRPLLIVGQAWVAPPNRSPFVEDHGYSNGPAHYPPEVNTPRTWEINDRRSPLPLEATSYEHNIRTDRETRDARIAEPTYPSHPSGHPQDSEYHPSLRSGFSVEMPEASSTPSRPPAPVESSPNSSLPKQPIVMQANYDNFEQSMVMEAASPEVRNPAQARLQDRVDQYPGFAPASFVPVETSGPSLYARLTQDREQLPLAERLASSESHQPNKAAYGKGAKPTASGNTGQLAARLGVSTGERSQPLANRFVDEPRHRSSYQSRDREPPARPGGGLMARMVGDKKSGE